MGDEVDLRGAWFGQTVTAALASAGVGLQDPVCAPMGLLTSPEHHR